MEVASVDAIPLSYQLGDGRGYGSARGTVTQRTSTLIRVETGDGAVGWGEAFGPPKSIATLVDELLTDMVVGMDPYEVESLCDRNYTGLYHFGSRGVVQSAISGIDIALWDLIGRVTGTSIARLLGGRNREHVTPYASTMYITQWGQPPAEPIQAAVDEGFSAAKIKIGRNIEDDVERVQIARDRLGDDARLMVDCNGNYRPEQAIELDDALSPFDVSWIEEPIPPENRSGYAELKRAIDTPVAAGEASYGRFEFKELIDDRTVDVVQPDVCKCGGLSEARFIAKLATTENLAVSPHVWTGAVGLAASLQFAGSLPNYPHSTNVPEPVLFEVDRADNGLREELLTEPFDFAGDTLEIPDAPGLGVEPDPAAIERYRVDQSG
ncbi:mandelate racemase/muconate lactonizing enzyme family protein [Halorubrum sp. CBA1125]|uniref:mandelate racemase/muconate lactonizing enzyme family protein n=1 Tax=Halorubrum sp. CBA1125 TaxID=2668072 RepID=UPI0012E87455|nr:mandelate racemase/muconate lactonizing enzyme family protein [Halorubrum sp. CBA1125]MUW13675.1 mandelate racemase/muconate lactonizing enzyme family protein [Halorubrum sp. CBA1125]